MALILALAASGCDDDFPRDQYYGTDAGANYRPPDARSDAPAAADAPIDRLPDGGPG